MENWALSGIVAALVVACSGAKDTGSIGGSTGGASGSGGGAGSGGMPGSSGGGSSGSSGAGGRGTGGSSGGAPSGGGGSGGVSSGGTSSGGASSGGGGSGGETDGGSAASVGCPATAPASNAPCSANQENQTCTWGNATQPSCRPSAVCTGGKWQVAPPPAYCSTLPATCPQTPPTYGTACGDDSLKCLYPDDTMCSCRACECQLNGCPHPCPVVNTVSTPVGTKVWYCAQAPAPFDTRCPKTIPNDGTPCEAPLDEHCPRGTCSNLDVACAEGQWKWSYPAEGCPICASPDTPIATPGGERPIATIAVGDLVYGVVDDAIVPVPVLRVGHTRVFGHHVVRVRLSSGRTLDISPGHPTADGRLFSELRRGSTLDGTRIDSVEFVPYEHAETYDILPASEGGTYYAAGVRVGSTLANIDQRATVAR